MQRHVEMADIANDVSLSQNPVKVIERGNNMEIIDAKNSHVRRCTNVRYTDVKPVLTEDRRFIITCNHAVVLVVSCKTGEVYRKFEGHKAAISNLHLTGRQGEILSASKDGIIIVWDYIINVVQKKLTLVYTKILKVLYAVGSQDVLVIREKKKKNTLLPWVTRVVLSGGKEPVKGNDLFEVSTKIKSIVIDLKGKYIAYVGSRKESRHVYIHCLQTSRRRSYTYGYLESVIGIVFNPSATSVALADSCGRIQLWSNFWEKSKMRIQDLHWHSSALRDMAFSSSGEMLWSVGTEGVIVNWHLQTLSKNFISKLGSDIKYISTTLDDSELVVTLSSNKTKIISVASQTALYTLQGLSREANPELGMVRDPRTNALVLSGVPAGILQFYNPDCDAVVQEADVTLENFISLGNKDKVVYNSKVELVTFSYDGSWMVAVETSKFQRIPAEIRIKFFMLCQKENRYNLHTVVEPPHAGDILCLVSRPKCEFGAFDYMVATTSKDRYFKLWALYPTEGDGCTWNASFRCKYGNLKCSKAAFSADGSLLAVVFEEIVTLWNPDKGSQLSSLTSPVQGDNIKQICFCHKESSQYFLATTSFYVIAWDLLSCSLCWTLKADVELLLADPFSKYVLLFTQSDAERSRVFYFEPASPRPVAMAQNVVPAGQRILSAALLPRPDYEASFNAGILSRTGRLFFMVDKQQILTVEQKRTEGDQHDEEPSKDDLLDQTDFVKVFGFQKKAQQAAEKKLMETVQNFPSSDKVVRKIMAAPSHVLPSVESLSVMLFKAALCKVHTNTSSHSADSKDDTMSENEDENEAMDLSSEDEEPPVIVGSAKENPPGTDTDDDQDKIQAMEPLTMIPHYDTSWFGNLFRKNDTSDLHDGSNLL